MRRVSVCLVIEEVEVPIPVQSVHLVPISLLLIRSNIPLLLQLLQIVVNVLLELPHALRRERVRHSLSLARMLRTISCIEQSPFNAHKRVVVFALQETVAVAVDLRDRICVGNANMVWLDSHKLAILCVRVMDCKVTLALTTLCEKPEVRPCGGEGCGDVANLPIADVGQKVV